MLKRYAIKSESEMAPGEPFLNDGLLKNFRYLYRDDEDVEQMMQRDERIFVFGERRFIMSGHCDAVAVVDLQDDWHQGKMIPDDEMIVRVYEGAQRLECVRGDSRPPYLAVPHNATFVNVSMADAQAAWSRVLKKRLSEAKPTTIYVQIDHEDFV